MDRLEKIKAFLSTQYSPKYRTVTKKDIAWLIAVAEQSDWLLCHETIDWTPQAQEAAEKLKLLFKK